MRVLTVLGTRAEAIKMAPVVRALAEDKFFDSKVCITAEQGKGPSQVLELFGIDPHFDLNLIKPGQTLFETTSLSLQALRGVYQQWEPDIVLVHGDTTTTFSASLSAFYAQIKVGHIESGGGSHNKFKPWPHEMHRVLTGSLADLHFAPTTLARDNLIEKGVAHDTIYVTGNTVIDVLLEMVERLGQDRGLRAQMERMFDFLDPTKRLILATDHWSENLGADRESLCQALCALAARSDVQIVFPLDRHARVRDRAQQILGGLWNVHLIPPLEYLPYVYLIERCSLLITDTGRVQEEAPSLGKPVLEMKEGNGWSFASVEGTDTSLGHEVSSLVHEANYLLDEVQAYESLARVCHLYGDGRSAGRIRDILKYHGQSPRGL